MPMRFGDFQAMPFDPEQPGSGRDPEGRAVPEDPDCIREKMLDKTIADSFPSSDPPSTIPNPCGGDNSFVSEDEADNAA